MTKILRLCANVTGATIDVDYFSERRGNTKWGSAKYLAGKEKTGKVYLRYINDIHAIDVFFANKQCNSWVCDTRSVGMSVIQCNTIQKLQWPKRLAKYVVVMHIGN